MSITRHRLPGALARLLRGAADLVLPAPCLACAGPASGSGHLGLCLACRGRLVAPAPGCATCGEVLPAARLTPLPEGWTCGACRRRPPAHEALAIAWSYEGPVVPAIRGLKFGRLEHLGRHLARDLAERLAGRPGEWDLVVPVPLHWRRRWRRGYNQAERIARPLADSLGVPVSTALRRRRATRPQTGLARDARQANLRGAFAVRRGRDLEGRRVVLVDDVVTTGATLGAAAEALRAAGAERVMAVAAARTPSQR